MKTDMRTRAGREEEIRERVEEWGGFNMDWITENKKRAAAAAGMMKRGKLIVTKVNYPWYKARLAKPKKKP
jgi:hypothetical protein